MVHFLLIFSFALHYLFFLHFLPILSFSFFLLLLKHPRPHKLKESTNKLLLSPQGIIS